MKKLPLSFAIAAFAAVVSTATLSAHAQDTRESAVAGMRKVEAKEMDATYHRKAPLAQKLVDDALAAHPDVLLMAIHGGAPKYDIIASNFGRIGKLGDEDDLRVIHTGKPNLEVAPRGDHFEVELAMHDKAGKVVGALGVVFNYKPGDDKKAMQATSEAIVAEMEKKIKTEASLFAPAK